MEQNRHWEGRIFLGTESLLTYGRIFDGWTYAEIAEEPDCSPCFLCHRLSTQREQVRREPVQSPLRLFPTEREEVSHGLQQVRPPGR